MVIDLIFLVGLQLCPLLCIIGVCIVIFAVLVYPTFVDENAKVSIEVGPVRAKNRKPAKRKQPGIKVKSPEVIEIAALRTPVEKQNVCHYCGHPFDESFKGDKCPKCNGPRQTET